MKIILFGAGASYADSRVPLTKDLFLQLQNSFPNTWGNIPPIKRADFEKDFELAIEDYLWPTQSQSPIQMTKYPNKQESLRRLLLLDLAKFFIRFKLMQDSLYVSFFRTIKESNGSYCVASLNYDTLLFQTLKKINYLFDIIGINEEGNKNQVRICLPHGCSNIYSEGGFTPDGELHASPGVSIEINPLQRGGVKASSSKIGYLEDEKIFDKKYNGFDPFFPVMSHIQPSKFAIYGQNFIEKQFQTWHEWTKIATRILIIGVKCSHETICRDQNLWDSLKRTPGKIMYITVDDDNYFVNTFKPMRFNTDVSRTDGWSNNLEGGLAFLANQ